MVAQNWLPATGRYVPHFHEVKAIESYVRQVPDWINLSRRGVGGHVLSRPSVVARERSTSDAYLHKSLNVSRDSIGQLGQGVGVCIIRMVADGQVCKCPGMETRPLEVVSLRSRPLSTTEAHQNAKSNPVTRFAHGHHCVGSVKMVEVPIESVLKPNAGYTVGSEENWGSS